MPRSYPSDAIREAGSCAARVRRAFAAALASRLCLPATVCWTPGLPATCWLDPDDGFNHARVLTISGPKSCCLEAPLILRVSINSLAFNYVYPGWFICCTLQYYSVKPRILQHIG